MRSIENPGNFKKPHISRKIIVTLIYATVWFGVAGFYIPAPQTNVFITTYYLEGLDSLQLKLFQFKLQCGKKTPANLLIQYFHQCRLAYKKVAVISNYFNLYETKQLNSPPIRRIESEIPDKIIEPQGFQAVEEIVFKKKYNGNDYVKMTQLLNNMEAVVGKLKAEPGMDYKFKDALVWDAMRCAIIEVMTKGISGFDSPVANYSIPETRASIASIKNLLFFYKPLIDKKEQGSYVQITNRLNKCIVYLTTNSNFNGFDRMYFITNYLNPLYKILIQERIKCGIDVPEGKSPLLANEESIFNVNAFDINFYSPPKDYWVTPERVQLGKRLFADPILSGTHNRSCASCHQPERAFTDGLARPYSLDNKTVLERNTPTLLNAGLQTKQFYDSRSDILENQLVEVVHNVKEMEGSLKKSVSELRSSAVYSKLFATAYSAEKEPINAFNIANAISSYIRSLRTLNSRFDNFMRGDKNELSINEIKGFNLFMGKAKCGTCHFIPLFNGVVPPFYNETESEVLGIPQSREKRHAVLDKDLGKYNYSGSVIHKYAFKTPTLRNIELTAPYMHNGIYNNLEEVLEFYNNGGGKGLKIAPENQTLPFDHLNLSRAEIKNIIAFLKTLTDTSSISRQ